MPCCGSCLPSVGASDVCGHDVDETEKGVAKGLYHLIQLALSGGAGNECIKF